MHDSKLETFSHCRKIYKDIILGYSKDSSGNLYVKHFKETDIGEINEIKQQITSECKEKGLLSKKEKIKILIDADLWTLEKEQETDSLEEQIVNHKQAKSKLFIKAQVDSVQKQIDTKFKKLNKISKERNSILGLTLESFTDNKTSESIIRLALFKDKNLEEPAYTEDEYDELEPNELNALVERYSSIMEKFTEEYLKMVAASSFFMNNLLLCKNNPFIFFGKPICELTNFQIDIFSSGLSYKSILERDRTPPAEFNLDLERMVEWYESAGHMEKMSERTKNRDGSTMMGASKKELEMMTNKDELVIDLAKEAKKKGGTLDMEDFIRIHTDTSL